MEHRFPFFISSCLGLACGPGFAPTLHLSQNISPSGSRFYQTFHLVLKSCQHLPENFSSSLKVLPSFANKLFIQSQSLASLCQPLPAFASLCQQTFHPVLKSCWPLQWMFESIYIAFYLSLVSYFEVGICWKGSLGSLELFLKETKDCAIPVV